MERFDLVRFPLSDMIGLAARLRREVAGAPTFDAAAQVLVDQLFDGLRDGSDEPALALARVFRTAKYDDLDEELQGFARRMAPGSDLAGRRCLVLHATRGVEDAWNDPARSEGHRALPLVSVEAVQRSPMISQLIGQLGVPTADVVDPDEDVLLDLAQRSYNVFHVSQADGSPYVPAQDGFVQRYGIRSVIGFGAMLPTGDLFATILFARVPISRAVADRFRTVSLSVKSALLPFAFGEQEPIDELRTQLGAVVDLLDTHERTALEQARGLEATSQGLQRLAEAALVVNSTLDVDALLELITEQARVIVPAHQSVTSLTAGEDWEQAISSVSLSDRYARWRDFDVPPDGSGIYRLVAAERRSYRMTQAELEAHPAWRGFGDHVAEHPPMRGWLAAPLIGREGNTLGLIQLSDREDGGEFTAEDEALLVQLAQLASATLENARLASMVAHEEAARSREEMLAGLSHDMKTPLAVISGLAATFSLDPDAPLEERVEGYEALSRQAKRLRVLVQRFLDYSALEAGRSLHVNPRPMPVGRVVDAVADLFRDHREIVVDLPDGLPPVHADQDRLEQALANLVSNAIKFSPDGASVRVEGHAREGSVEVAVIDQGAGIDPGELDAIWQKFRRGSNARGTEGSGLGLYIARALIEAQGGSVEVRSRRDGGSTFTVALPTAPSGTESV